VPVITINSEAITTHTVIARRNDEAIAVQEWIASYLAMTGTTNRRNNKATPTHTVITKRNAKAITTHTVIARRNDEAISVQE
jgi:hypothetical protein